MHFYAFLATLPAAVLATGYCPRDFALNATMAEGPCSRAALPTIVSTARPSSLAHISFSNGTTLQNGDFRLWNDKAYSTPLEAAPASKMHGAISLASKMDLGFYTPVCAGDGVCEKKNL